MSSRWLVPLLAVLVLGALVWTLSGSRGGEGEAVTVYSGRGEQFLEPLAAAFESRTGIRVRALPSGSAELLQRILHEGDRTPCDVYLTNDSATLEAARERGLLAPLPPRLLAGLEERFRAGDGTWIAVSARVRVVVYNPGILEGRISSVLDLADGRFQGKVCRIQSTNESFVSGIAAMRSALGRDRTRAFLAGLQANTEPAGVQGKHTPIVEAVAAGEFPLGYVNHYYYYRHKAKRPGDPVDILWPDQEPGGMGAAWNVSGAALLAAAPNPGPGRRFVEFLLSEEAQRIFADQNYEYPVVEGVPTHPDVRPRAGLALAAAGIEEMGRLRSETVELIQELGLR